MVSKPYFKKRNKYRQHIMLVAQALGIAERVELQLHKHPINKITVFEYWGVSSLSDERLRGYFLRWYPGPSYKKVVPRDLILTPRMLLHWFMDDGSSWQRRPESKTIQISITLSCQCFCKEDQLFLCEQLGNLGISAKITPIKDGTGFRIRILQSSARRFFDVVGPCPVSDLNYKWKLAS